MKDLKARTCVYEQTYIDKDFLIDYQEFYARSFENIPRFTQRVHYFADDFSKAEFEQMLEKDDVKSLQESYLGFTIIKPIRDLEGNYLVGRTSLRTYPPSTNGRKRFYITMNQSASLFGIDLRVDSIPFQAQDQGVSACATIALWTAFQAIGRAFGIQERSPAEITQMATEFPSQSRVFPQGGLTLSQMINCIRKVDLDLEVVNAEDSDIITTAVKAFTYAGIPIIAALKLSGSTEEDYHAAIIDGYQYDGNGQVTELYVHDDQIGPYSRVEPDHDFLSWKNTWNDLGLKVEPETLLIPVYHKLRLPFYSIYHHYVRKKEVIGRSGLVLDLYLTTLQRYKNFLAGKKIVDKVEKLQMHLPRFIYVERLFESGKREPLMDDVFDGTAIRSRKLASVEYS